MASESGPAMAKWAVQLIRANNIVKPVSDDDAKSSIWTDRYAQSQPAYIAHPNYGPCLLRAKRQGERTGLLPGRLYYLVTLVTPVDDRQLKESRRGYYQVPASVSIEDKNGMMQVLVFVYALPRLITQFVLTDPQESTNVTVYDGKVYTRMLLSELRRHVDVENDETYRIAFDAFKQSNTTLLADRDVSAPLETTRAAEERLIEARLQAVPDDNRYALAPPFLRRTMMIKDAHKGRAHIDASIAEPLHDPHGLFWE